MIRGHPKCFIKIKLKIFLTLDKIGIAMFSRSSLIRIQYSYVLVTEILFYEPWLLGVFLHMGMRGKKPLADLSKCSAYYQNCD